MSETEEIAKLREQLYQATMPLHNGIEAALTRLAQTIEIHSAEVGYSLVVELPESVLDRLLTHMNFKMRYPRDNDPNLRKEVTWRFMSGEFVLKPKKECP